MAETIKGINVVIGAETSGLSAALSDVNKRSRDIQSELKQVEKLLKLDPTNTELIAQKQKLLGDAVENTSEKLNRLRQAQAQVNEQFARGEINEKQYRAFQREIAKTEQELRSYESRVEGAARETKGLGQESQKTGRDLKQMGDSVKGAGEKMSVGLTAPLVGFAALAIEGTEEFRKFTARLETNAELAGESMDRMNNALRDTAAVTGEVDSSVEGLSNLLASGFKGDKFEKVLEQLQGAAIKFSDTLKFEGIADGLQETLATGAAIGPFAELLERSGASLDDFNAGLEESIKSGTQQQYVLEQLANLGLAEVNAKYREGNAEAIAYANAQYDIQAAMSQIGTLLLPVLTQVIDAVSGLLEWFNGLDESTQKVILVIGGLAAALGPLLIIVGQMITAVGAISGAFAVFAPAASGAAAAAAGTTAAAGGLGAALTALTGPIGITIAAIAALVAGLVILYKKNDEFRAFVDETWAKIKDSISKAVEAIRDYAQPIIEEIVGFFKEQLDELKAFWDENSAAILQIVKQVFGQIKADIELVMGIIKGIFQAAWPIIEVIFKIAWAAIKLIVSTAIDIIKGVIQTFIKIITGDWKGAWESIKETVKNVWDNVMAFLKGINLKQIGKDIIQGLIDGIGSMAGALKKRVSDMANSITDGMKNMLGIKSPSRVMMELGEYTGEGFAIGIGRTISDVHRQADKMAAAASGVLGGMTAPSIGSSAGVAAAGAVSFEGMFAGAVFNVRSDEDIKALARELYSLQQTSMRGAGLA